MAHSADGWQARIDSTRVVEHGGLIYHLNTPACSALLRMLRLADYPADGVEVPEMLVTMARDTAYELGMMELIVWRKLGLSIRARFTARGLTVANMINSEGRQRQRALHRYAAR